MTRKKRTSGQTKNRLPKREKPLFTHFSSLLRAFASQVIVATGTTTTFQSFFWIQRSEDVKTSSLGTVLKSRHLNFLASKIIHLNLRHVKKKIKWQVSPSTLQLPAEQGWSFTSPHAGRQHLCVLWQRCPAVACAKTSAGQAMSKWFVVWHKTEAGVARDDSTQQNLKQSPHNRTTLRMLGKNLKT